MDCICIKDLEVYCHHGVLKEETALGQKFLFTIEMFMDTSFAGAKDDLSLSVSYAEVAHFVDHYVKQNTFQLLESVAEHLAKEILINFSLLKKIKIKIKKPWAPILLPLDTASVEIERGWHTAYISIGSNMGNKKENLLDAIRLLGETPYCKVTKVATILETEPYGYLDQDDFLNTAVECVTLDSPYELLERVQEIERKLKRERVIHWGPRTIDLDIILYDEITIVEENLIIPHKEMHKRTFVLEPLNEIAAFAKHPVLNQCVLQLLEKLTGNESMEA